MAWRTAATDRVRSSSRRSSSAPDRTRMVSSSFSVFCAESSICFFSASTSLEATWHF